MNNFVFVYIEFIYILKSKNFIKFAKNTKTAQ